MSYYGDYSNDNDYSHGDYEDDDYSDGDDEDGDYSDGDDDDGNNNYNNDNSIAANIGYCIVNNDQATNSYAHEATYGHGVNNNGQGYTSPVVENDDDSEYEDNDDCSDDGDGEGEDDGEYEEDDESCEEEEEEDDENCEDEEEDEECDEEDVEEEEDEEFEYDEYGNYIEQDEEGYDDDYVTTNGAKFSQGYVNAPIGPTNTGLTNAIAVPTVPPSGTSIVTMPSGIQMHVSIPINPCTHSYSSIDYNVHLMPLRDNDARTRDERAMVAKEMMSSIKQHALQQQGGGRFSSYEIVAVHKVQNCCLWSRFRDKQRKLSASGYGSERMLFHGSTAADTIIRTGFDKKCAKTSGMFGNGIYFAEHSSKSNQYVYGLLGGNGCPAHADKSCYVCLRKMLLCRVALGKMYRLQKACPMDRPPAGFHSVSGEPGVGLVYPEYTVYNEDQVYPEYLITYRIVR